MKLINKLKVYVEIEEDKIQENNKHTVMKVQIYKKELINKPKIQKVIKEDNLIRI